MSQMKVRKMKPRRHFTITDDALAHFTKGRSMLEDINGFAQSNDEALAQLLSLAYDAAQDMIEEEEDDGE